MTDQTGSSRRWDFDRAFRLFLVLSGVVGTLLLLRFLADVLIPFAIALLLAYLLHPVVSAFQVRLGGRRGPAIALTVFAALAVLVSFLIVVVPLTVSEMQNFGTEIRNLSMVENGPAAAETIPSGSPAPGATTTEPAVPSTTPAEGMRRAYQEFRARRAPWARRVLDQTVAGLSEQLSEEKLPELLPALAARIAPGLLGLLTGTLSFLLGLSGLIVVSLLLIFILLDYEQVTDAWPELIPPAYREAVVQFVEEFSLAMRRYFRGQCLVAIMVGVLFALGFGLLDLRMGILLGLFVGMLNMVPYLQIVGLVPALLLGVLRALEHGSSVFGSLLLVLLVFAVVQAIQETLIVPRVMGRITGLRPLSIMLGLFIWGKLLGFLGLVLAIPLTCLGLAYYSRFVLGKADAEAVAPQ